MTDVETKCPEKQHCLQHNERLFLYLLCERTSLVHFQWFVVGL